MESFVYILYFAKADKYYVGSTNNIDRRIKQHKSGHTPTTKRLGDDCELVFSQKVASLKLARRTEFHIKSWKRRDFIKRIIADDKISFLDDMHP